MTDGTGTTTFQYDELDRLTRVSYPDTKVVSYAYDAAGNRTSLTNPGNVVFTHTYDTANRLTQITQGTRTWTFGYDGAGNRTSLTHPNGASIAYTYQTNNWLATITHKRTGAVTFDTITYGYDANGNRTTLTDYTGTTTFGYDALNRLTSAAYPGTYGTWSWTYDAVGNRLTQNSPSGQTTYGYDANNRLTNAGSTTYSYDQNGNLTSISNGTTFTYDAHNRLTQANLPGGLVVQYLYNGDGLKIRRTEGSAVTRYYHDGIRPIYETNSAGNIQAQLERDIFGNLLARQTGGGSVFYYHHDGLGSTVGLTNASGQVAAQRTYDAWGNRRTSSGAAPGNYQFAGAELDTLSGLYHMGARFYDPTIGRWLSEDPVQDKHFEPATLNFYVYAYNDPVIYVDQDGKVVLLAVLAAGWAAAEIALTLKDVYNALKTLGSNASTNEKVGAVGFALLGIFGPGGGYGSFRGMAQRFLKLGKHVGFISQVKNYSNTGLLSAAKNFAKNIAQHRQKLKQALAGGDTQLAEFYKKEIQTYEEQLKIVLEEMELRGLMDIP